MPASYSELHVPSCRQCATVVRLARAGRVSGSPRRTRRWEDVLLLTRHAGSLNCYWPGSATRHYHGGFGQASDDVDHLLKLSAAAAAVKNWRSASRGAGSQAEARSILVASVRCDPYSDRTSIISSDYHKCKGRYQFTQCLYLSLLYFLESLFSQMVKLVKQCIWRRFLVSLDGARSTFELADSG